jgi:hypothetical protein
MSDVDLPSLWWTCPKPPGFQADADRLLTYFLLTISGVLFGFGLTRFVQSLVPLAVRKQLIRFAHLTGPIVWATSMTSCSRVLFPLLVGQTYLWGSEPYDDVFHHVMWQRALRLWREKREWIHLYWLWSSLFVHTWFVGGAAGLLIGVSQPQWLLMVIFGFSFSHLARLFSYSYYDRLASWLEVIGIMFLCWAMVSEILDPHAEHLVWLGVAVFERLTHLPSAIRGDAGWMRSYDLWEAMCAEEEHLPQQQQPEMELTVVRVTGSSPPSKKDLRGHGIGELDQQHAQQALQSTKEEVDVLLQSGGSYRTRKGSGEVRKDSYLVVAEGMIMVNNRDEVEEEEEKEEETGLPHRGDS